MRVLLRSDVASVGRRGDLVEVADGFARNFLFPSGQAMPASDGMELQAASMRRARDLRQARDEEAAHTKADVLAGASVVIAARAGSTGRLFGSVGPADIAQALAEQHGVEIDREVVELEEPIKAVGSTSVELHLTAELSVTVTVEVTTSS
jgi:large subunit ribosomal protein L9